MWALALGKRLGPGKADVAKANSELRPSLARHPNPRLVNAFSSNMPQSICGSVCSISWGIWGWGYEREREECEDLDMPIEVCYAWNSICRVCWGAGAREWVASCGSNPEQREA